MVLLIPWGVEVVVLQVGVAAAAYWAAKTHLAPQFAPHGNWRRAGHVVFSLLGMQFVLHVAKLSRVGLSRRLVQTGNFVLGLEAAVKLRLLNREAKRRIIKLDGQT